MHKDAQFLIRTKYIFFTLKLKSLHWEQTSQSFLPLKFFRFSKYKLGRGYFQQI